MKKLTMTIELTYDDELMYGNEDDEAREWFFKDVLSNANYNLRLNSVAVDDEVGDVRILSIDGKPVPPFEGDTARRDFETPAQQNMRLKKRITELETRGMSASATARWIADNAQM